MEGLINRAAHSGHHLFRRLVGKQGHVGIIAMISIVLLREGAHTADVLFVLLSIADLLKGEA